MSDFAAYRHLPMIPLSWRRLGRVLLGVALVAMVLALALATLLFEFSPLLDPDHRQSAEEKGRARRVLDYGIHSARQLDVTNTLELDAAELNATVNYLLKQVMAGDARFLARKDQLALVATSRLAAQPLPIYLNVAVVLESQAGRVALAKVRVGDANIPASWMDIGLAMAQRFSAVAGFWAVADQTVRELEVQEGGIRLTYQWNSASLQQLRGLFLEVTGKKRLRHYHARLAEVVNNTKSARLELGQLLQALFELARERSREHDPVEENRALLLVAGAYLTGGQLAPALASHYSGHTAERRTLLLRNRLDLAKHFTISAALAATANTTFAELVGVAKEIDDSHGGSGFNFQDLAADMAGTRFGQLAVGSGESARRLQKHMSRDGAEERFMPVVRDLPEQLDAKAFAERYGEVDSPRFEAVQAEIERRLDALALYRPG